MKIVLIPGLGYDHRIFKNLNLSDYNVQYLNWIEPISGEEIHDYAQRLFAKVEKASEEIILIGHSLGGIVAQEIASENQIEKIFLVSSIKSRKELPTFFKWIKPLFLDKLFTKEMSIKTIKYWGRTHGFENTSEIDLFKSMVGKNTNSYLQWALRALSCWHEPPIKFPTKIIHIHGTEDKTFPYRLIEKPDFTIENGSHICILKKAEELTVIIKNEVQQ